MRNSNFIAESVFKVNLKYTKLQNKTKEAFFKCLNEGKDLEYFSKEIHKIWDKTNVKFTDEQIKGYSKIIHEQNTGKRENILIQDKNMIMPLITNEETERYTDKFVNQKEREYKYSTRSYAYENNKDEYLKKKVEKYTNQIVPYYYKGTNTIQRYAQLSTYQAMIHNINLTRMGWNTTMYDADIVGQTKFWIPYHSFSCPYCISHQNRILTKKEVIDLVGDAQAMSGDILHPNCKCELTFYLPETEFNEPDYSDAELKEQYDIRQKVNSLTLRKEEIATDMKIQQRLGNQDMVDKLNQQRNEINKQIRELKEALPTETLQKQVVAINR